MNNSISLFLLCVLLMPFPVTQSSTAAAQPVVTAAQVNGTWKNQSGEFKIWALGHQKLQVEFTGTYEYKTSAGLIANVGGGSGVAFIEGDTAVFKPEGRGDDCKITMKFIEGKLAVQQKGPCNFARHVTATGTYRKTSSRKPHFEDE